MKAIDTYVTQGDHAHESADAGDVGVRECQDGEQAVDLDGTKREHDKNKTSTERVMVYLIEGRSLHQLEGGGVDVRLLEVDGLSELLVSELLDLCGVLVPVLQDVNILWTREGGKVRYYSRTSQ